MWGVCLLLWRVRSNGVSVASLACVVGEALPYHTHTLAKTPFSTNTFPRSFSNTPHTRTASVTTPQHHRITSVTNMAPKKAKPSAAQKAANKAAGLEKRKATLAAKAAAKQGNDPACQANLARANANFGDNEEERARSGNAPEAQQQVDEPAEEDEPTAPETSNKAGKRPAAPVGGSSAGPSSKRRRTAASTGPPAAIPVAEQGDAEEAGGEYSPEAEGGEGDEEDDVEVVVPPSGRKSRGKAKAGTSSAASKTAARLRNTALAGPLRPLPASSSNARHTELEQISERSLAVDLDDPLVINNTRTIWKVCERCASHLEHGKHASHLRSVSAAVLMRSIGHTCSGGSDDPFFPRRCARCTKGNGKCVWLRPSSHSGLYEAMNNAIRAWLAWEDLTRGVDEEETVRAAGSFRELNERFLAILRSF